MDLIERVKAECRGKYCESCKLYKCCPESCAPATWDIEAIRKALGETSDKASDKDDLSGSAKRKMTLEGLVKYAKEELGINIILKDGKPQSFEEIFGYTTKDNEDIVVPEKWKNPTNLIGTEFVQRKQNEIIDCLEQIKERMK